MEDSMEITIRRVSLEDAYDYTLVHIASWRDAYVGIIPDEYLDKMTADLEQRVERYKQMLAEPGDCEFYCVMCDGDMIGRLVFNKNNSDEKPDAGEVNAIYLLADYWGKGYGRQMMDFAVAELRYEGCQDIIVWVLEENSRGRQFYENYGFKLDGAQKTLDLGKPLICLRYVLK